MRLPAGSAGRPPARFAEGGLPCGRRAGVRGGAPFPAGRGRVCGPGCVPAARLGLVDPAVGAGVRLCRRASGIPLGPSARCVGRGSSEDGGPQGIPSCGRRPCCGGPGSPGAGGRPGGSDRGPGQGLVGRGAGWELRQVVEEAGGQGAQFRWGRGGGGPGAFGGGVAARREPGAEGGGRVPAVLRGLAQLVPDEVLGLGPGQPQELARRAGLRVRPGLPRGAAAAGPGASWDSGGRAGAAGAGPAQPVTGLPRSR